MNRDGYVRLREVGPLCGFEPEGPDPLLFIDVEPGAPASGLRRVPHGYLASVRAVVVRGKVDQVSGVCEILESIGRRVPCLSIEHRVGEAAVLQPRPEKPGLHDEYVQRVRSAELRSLLEHGEAIWESKNFHFLLPSGRHARSFIRPAHALRSLRDAHVIATWLLAHVDPSGVGIVSDTHVIGSVLLALQLELGKRQINIGAIQMLDGYPVTTVDTANAVRAVTEQHPALLAIVSVCGTGGVRDLITSAAWQVPFLERAEIVSIFDTGLPRAVEAPRESTDGGDTRVVRISSLVNLGDSRRPQKYQSFDSACALCDDPDSSQLVPVDVDTFDVRFPTFINREMPSIQDPQRNRSLWEACDRSNALLFESEADAPVQLWRPTERMAWKVDWNALLRDDQFSVRSRVRIEEELKQERGRERSGGAACPQWDRFDLVLTPKRDVERPGFSDYWETIRPVLGAVAPTPFPDYGAWNDELIVQVKRASRILVFTLGTVTGTTLQRALNEVQRSRTDASYDLHGFVIHARPERHRTWQVLSNSFAHRLLGAFVSYVPYSLSPLRDEIRYLEAEASTLSPEAQRFLEHRLAVCKGEEGLSDYGFLWGARTDERISPHSIFGDRLKARATFLAVGNAIQARRERDRRPPYRLLFEMPAIARSYYDPLIFACMLRWLRTPEMWWGELQADAEKVLGEVLERASDHQRPLLLGELLLACAQGKIPDRGIELVVGKSTSFTSSDLHVSAVLELGKHLVERRRRKS